MAYVNLPPNFQDIFSAITDRIARLESGPNAAMTVAESAQATAVYSQSVATDAEIQAINAGILALSAQNIAVSSQSVATNAQVQAINAGVLALSAQNTALTSQSVATSAQTTAINAQVAANAAASQATIAQSQATIASSQATAAQVTANGKNKVYYSVSLPGTTANTVGDIWYQYGTSGTYANKVIAQWTGAGGSSWTSVVVSGLVISNIDAGTITVGTLSAIQISAGSGSTQFSVSPSGYMSAQGVYVKGNITADSGTFTGSIRADAGYFGTGSGATLTNGWQIGATGITGVGTASITGGLISGSSINIGTGAFTVNSLGALVATNATITGAIRSSTGYFGTGTGATLTNGWQIGATGITGVGTATITGGLISGSSIDIGTGQFTVNSLGAMVAQNATITGSISATSGYFGSTATGNYWSINSSGITGVGSATITGGLISGSSINIGTGAFTVSSAGVISATSGTIGGSTLGASTITGGTIRTAASGASVALDGANNALKFTNSLGNAIGWIVPYSSNGMIFNYGATPSVNFTAFPAVAVGSGSIILQADVGNSLSVSTVGINASSLGVIGTFTASNAAYIQDASTTANAANARIDVGDGRLRRSTASSLRYKENVTNIWDVAEYNPKKLLTLPVVAFTFKNDYLSADDDRYEILVPGFIAEQVDEIYPIATDYTNGPESWNDRIIIPAMLALIQDQEKRIQLLEGN